MGQQPRPSGGAESAEKTRVDVKLIGQNGPESTRHDVPPLGPVLDLDSRLELPFQVVQVVSNLDQPDQDRGRLFEREPSEERRLEPELVCQRLSDDAAEDVAAVGPVGRVRLLATVSLLAIDQSFSFTDVQQRIGGHAGGQLRQPARVYGELLGQLVSQGPGQKVTAARLVVVTQRLLGVLGDGLLPETSMQLGQLRKQHRADLGVHLAKVVGLDAELVCELGPHGHADFGWAGSRPVDAHLSIHSFLWTGAEPETTGL